MIRIISWNAGGLGSENRKNKLLKIINEKNPNIMCVQEVKTKFENLDIILREPENFDLSLNPPIRGNKGVLTYHDKKPNTVSIDIEGLIQDGRILKTEFEDFSLINVYFPLGSSKEQKVYKSEFYKRITHEIKSELSKNRPLIICGDFNVANEEIDLYNPEKSKSTVGFRKEERELFKELLETGLIDIFRERNQEDRRYTHWQKGREDTNEGWRIDYFLISPDLLSHVIDTGIYDEPEFREDHAPIFLDLNFS